MAKTPSSNDPEGKQQPTRKRPAPASANLISFAKSARYRGIVESPEPRRELEARLKIEEADADHARTLEIRKLDHENWRDRIVVRAGLTAIAVIGTYCLVLNALPGPHVEGRAWATSTLTGIVGGLVGYIVGTARK